MPNATRHRRPRRHATTRASRPLRRACAAALASALLAPATRAAGVPEAHAPAPPPAPAPGDSDVRPGQWNRRRPPAGWTVIETEHYQVQSQVGEETGRRLAEHLEGMLEQYQEVLPFRRRIRDFVLKIFESREAMLAYRPDAAGAAAWYDKGNRELVAFDTGIVLGERHIPSQISLRAGFTKGLSDDEGERVRALCEQVTDSYVFDVARVLSHEGWHQYFHHYTVSWVPMPSWLDEGLGDYFYTAERREDGEGYRLGALNNYRLRVVRRALAQGTTVPFGRMLEFEQADYYANPSVYYAQGWSMVHFLMQNEDERMRELIPRLIKHFKDSKNFHKSSEAILGDLDLEQLDRDWIRWLLMTQPADPLRELAREFGDRILPDDLLAPETWKLLYADHRTKLGWPPVDVTAHDPTGAAAGDGTGTDADG